MARKIWIIKPEDPRGRDYLKSQKKTDIRLKLFMVTRFFCFGWEAYLLICVQRDTFRESLANLDGSKTITLLLMAEIPFPTTVWMYETL